MFYGFAHAHQEFAYFVSRVRAACNEEALQATKAPYTCECDRQKGVISCFLEAYGVCTGLSAEAPFTYPKRPPRSRRPILVHDGPSSSP